MDIITEMAVRAQFGDLCSHFDLEIKNIIEHKKEWVIETGVDTSFNFHIKKKSGQILIGDDISQRSINLSFYDSDYNKIHDAVLHSIAYYNNHFHHRVDDLEVIDNKKQLLLRGRKNQ